MLQSNLETKTACPIIQKFQYLPFAFILPTEVSINYYSYHLSLNKISDYCPTRSLGSYDRVLENTDLCLQKQFVPLNFIWHKLEKNNHVVCHFEKMDGLLIKLNIETSGFKWEMFFKSLIGVEIDKFASSSRLSFSCSLFC